ncbi:transposase [Janthinobacterium sp.]|uniref:transposase n=1 Tax=Janthinobacterium sp. TaxID=1871054 RepID=UPI00293D5371|nr:transposase [Janthinobacterium sp.]
MRGDSGDACLAATLLGMARPLRIQFAGGLYHVTSRGNQREAIYLSELDRLTWLAIFPQVCQRYKWRCHVWCQMTNHYHIVIETLEPTLVRGMRQLNGVFTQYINRAHRRVGHVFQGRYKAILVEQESYLLELARYVVLNPVRAGIAGKAEDWKWSSYHSMLTPELAPEWLETQWLLGQFSNVQKGTAVAYRDFIGEGADSAPIWADIKGQIFLGSEEFLLDMQALVDTDAPLPEIPRAQQQAPDKPLMPFS